MFNPYIGNPYMIRKKYGKKTPIEEALLELSLYFHQERKIAECMTILYELIHYNLSHQVINVTTNLGERLLQSNFSINLSHIQMPFSIFEICFEQGLKIPNTNIQLPSCLVIIKPNEATLSAMQGWLSKASPKAIINIDPNLSNLFSIKYSLPSDPYLYHANLDFRKEEGKNIEEIIENLPTIQNMNSLSDSDKNIQKNVLRAVLGTICYLNTKDPDVSSYKFCDRPHFFNTPPKSVILGKNLTKCPPGWHLRKAHFRTLEHERFKRDETGSPKIIWIHAAEINKELKPAGDKVKEQIADV